MEYPRLSRRGFLAGSVVTGLLAVAIPVESVSSEADAARRAAAGQVPAAHGWRPTGAQRAVLTRDVFTPLLTKQFQMSSGLASHRVQLIEIEDIINSAGQGDPHCFSLIFEAKPGHVVPQSTRPMKTGKYSIELFVVPIDRGIDVQRYPAINNNPHFALPDPPVRSRIVRAQGETS
jgi:hypothetical protein